MDKTLEEKMLAILVDNQEMLKWHGEALEALQESHDRTFRRIDDFLSTLSLHEAEIAALRASRERLEKRVEKLEAAVGIAA